MCMCDCFISWPLGNLSNVQMSHYFSSLQAPGTPFILPLSTKAIRTEEGRKATPVQVSTSESRSDEPSWLELPNHLTAFRHTFSTLHVAILLHFPRSVQHTITYECSSSDEVTLLKATEHTTRIKYVIREPGVALSARTSFVTNRSGLQVGARCVKLLVTADCMNKITVLIFGSTAANTCRSSSGGGGGGVDISPNGGSDNSCGCSGGDSGCSTEWLYRCDRLRSDRTHTYTPHTYTHSTYTHTTYTTHTHIPHTHTHTPHTHTHHTHHTQTHTHTHTHTHS